MQFNLYNLSASTVNNNNKVVSYRPTIVSNSVWMRHLLTLSKYVSGFILVLISRISQRISKNNFGKGSLAVLQWKNRASSFFRIQSGKITVCWAQSNHFFSKASNAGASNKVLLEQQNKLGDLQKLYFKTANCHIHENWVP